MLWRGSEGHSIPALGRPHATPLVVLLQGSPRAPPTQCWLLSASCPTAVRSPVELFARPCANAARENDLLCKARGGHSHTSAHNSAHPATDGPNTWAAENVRELCRLGRARQQRRVQTTLSLAAAKAPTTAMRASAQTPTPSARRLPKRSLRRRLAEHREAASEAKRTARPCAAAGQGG